MDSLEDAMLYIKGYCNKHAECKQYCRLYNPNTDQCFISDGSIPADWIIVKDGDDGESEGISSAD